MTVKEYKNKLNRKLKELESDKALRIAVIAVNELRQKRIFEDGKNSSDKKIGTYSTKPMLATKSQFDKKSAFKQSKVEETRLLRNKKGIPTPNKRGDTKKIINAPLWIKFPKASKAVPVMELEGGYKEFRGIQGKEPRFVNLRYSGELRNDLGTGLLKKDNNLYQVVLKKDIDVKKIGGLEKKYGEVLKHTPFERKRFNEIVQFEINKIIND